MIFKFNFMYFYRRFFSSTLGPRGRGGGDRQPRPSPLPWLRAWCLSFTCHFSFICHFSFTFLSFAWQDGGRRVSIGRVHVKDADLPSTGRRTYEWLGKLAGGTHNRQGKLAGGTHNWLGRDTREWLSPDRRFQLDPETGQLTGRLLTPGRWDV